MKQSDSGGLLAHPDGMDETGERSARTAASYEAEIRYLRGVLAREARHVFLALQLLDEDQTHIAYRGRATLQDVGEKLAACSRPFPGERKAY